MGRSAPWLLVVVLLVAAPVAGAATLQQRLAADLREARALQDHMVEAIVR